MGYTNEDESLDVDTSTLGQPTSTEAAPVQHAIFSAADMSVGYDKEICPRFSIEKDRYQTSMSRRR
ncbi:hypothetical protein HC256_001649 [Beauveria bassiana]|nr:hypothetical protein HC256_001649 [Beauveria bassiana]